MALGAPVRLSGVESGPGADADAGRARWAGSRKRAEKAAQARAVGADSGGPRSAWKLATLAAERKDDVGSRAPRLAAPVGRARSGGRGCSQRLELGRASPALLPAWLPAHTTRRRSMGIGRRRRRRAGTGGSHARSRVRVEAEVVEAGAGATPGRGRAEPEGRARLRAGRASARAVGGRVPGWRKGRGVGAPDECRCGSRARAPAVKINLRGHGYCWANTGRSVRIGRRARRDPESVGVFHREKLCSRVGGEEAGRDGHDCEQAILIDLTSACSRLTRSTLDSHTVHRGLYEPRHDRARCVHADVRRARGAASVCARTAAIGLICGPSLELANGGQLHVGCRRSSRVYERSTGRGASKPQVARSRSLLLRCRCLIRVARCAHRMESRIV